MVLVRLGLVLAGFACAALAASAVLHLALPGISGIDAPEAPWIVVGSITLSIPFVALFVAYFAFLPATVAIGIAEIAGWRDRLTYAFAGCVIAGVVMVMFRGARHNGLPGGTGMPFPDGGGAAEPQLVGALLAAGLAGGLAYWLVAGRSAGNWRRAQRPDAPPAA